MIYSICDGGKKRNLVLCKEEKLHILNSLQSCSLSVSISLCLSLHHLVKIMVLGHPKTPLNASTRIISAVTNTVLLLQYPSHPRCFGCYLSYWWTDWGTVDHAHNWSPSPISPRYHGAHDYRGLCLQSKKSFTMLLARCSQQLIIKMGKARTSCWSIWWNYLWWWRNIRRTRLLDYWKCHSIIKIWERLIGSLALGIKIKVSLP